MNSVPPVCGVGLGTYVRVYNQCVPVLVRVYGIEACVCVLVLIYIHVGLRVGFILY